MMNFKKSLIAIEIASLDNVTITCTIRKLPVTDHTAYMVKIDILSGHLAKGNLHFILKIVFSLHICKKTCIFSKLV